MENCVNLLRTEALNGLLRVRSDAEGGPRGGELSQTTGFIDWFPKVSAWRYYAGPCFSPRLGL